MKNHHRCLCHYIPPHVVDKLCNAPSDEIREKSRMSSLQGKIRRLERSSKVDFKIISSLNGSSGTPAREVYDCKSTWEQRVTLARGEGGKLTGDQAVDTVYDSAGVIIEYLRKLDRNSIDNQGMNLILNVHFGDDYMNAFWDGDEMTFGDGDGEIFTDFTKSLDVVAHELAHGVIQYTANLDYYGQSGALNEHFADVFGSAVQQYYNKQDAGEADWLLGNEIMGPTLFGESLRSMKAPGSAYNNPLLGIDPQPSHMRNYYTEPEDNHGVHINSGIPNRAFYLVASDIGTENAVSIWYHALRSLWPTANFNDALNVISHSARLLTKAGKVPEGSTQAVRLAFKEVGLPN